MKNSRILLIIVLLGTMLLMVSCGGSDKPQYTEGQELTLTGKMKVIDNEGLFYVLVNENNEFFQLLNVEEQYKQDGVPIKAHVKIIRVITLAGVGPACTVLEYLE